MTDSKPNKRPITDVSPASPEQGVLSLQSISTLLDEKLTPIYDSFDNLRKDMNQLKCDTKEVSKKVEENSKEIETNIAKINSVVKKNEDLVQTVAGLETIKRDIKDLKQDTLRIQKETDEKNKQLERNNKKVESVIEWNDRLYQELADAKKEILKLEAYSRRDNLKFIGLEENPGENCENMIKTFCKQNLELPEEMVANMKFVRVHRIGIPRPGTIRPILARFHYFGDRTRVYQARKIQYEKQTRVEDKIFVLEDFPTVIDERRQKMLPVVNNVYKYKNTVEPDLKVSFVMDKLYLDKKVYTVENLDQLPSKYSSNVMPVSKVENDDQLFFWSKNSVFSNHYLCVFSAPDVRQFNCVEQYIMAQKARLFKDVSSYYKIMCATDPIEQKNMGKRIKGYNASIWLDACCDIVFEANKYKFEQNECLKNELLSTHGKELIEASPHDRYWGIGLRITDPAIFDKRNWKGDNVLGSLLVKVRDALSGQA